MRAIKFVERTEIKIDVPGLDIECSVRRVGYTINADQCARSMHPTRYLRHIIDAAGNVRKMAEANQPRIVIQKFFELF